MSATPLTTPSGSTEQHQSTDRAASVPRYLTLSAARALECNGCGDCCDSRLTDGYWTWGALPPDQYGGLFGGQPLIIPLARINGGWVDRPHDEQDALDLSPTRFRCSAFEAQPDGSGRCAIHDRERPAKCGEFPVGSPTLDAELALLGEVALDTSAFPRCTWHRVHVVADVDPRAEA